MTLSLLPDAEKLWNEATSSLTNGVVPTLASKGKYTYEMRYCLPDKTISAMYIFNEEEQGPFDVTLFKDQGTVDAVISNIDQLESQWQ